MNNRLFSTREHLRATILKDNVDIPDWAINIYGEGEWIYATDEDVGSMNGRVAKIHHVPDAHWDPLNSAVETQAGAFFERGHHRTKMAVLIIGGANSGKTTVQRIISQALKDAGVAFTLGEHAQHELTNLCEEEAVFVEGVKRIQACTDVMVEEIHTTTLRRFEQSGANPIVSYRGYDHSGGFKLIPVYKDKL